MSIAITLKINNAQQTVQVVHIEGGRNGQGASLRPSKVAARSRVKYELVEDDSGLAPENVATKRSGNDLLIAFEGGDINHPDLIIEDYYRDRGASLLGRAEDGNWYDFVPESGDVADAISVMNDSAQAGHALGGDVLSSGAYFPAQATGAFPVWLAGLPALGLLAAAGGGGSSRTPAPPPATPVLAADKTAPAAPGVRAAADGSVSVSPPSDSDVQSVNIQYVKSDGSTGQVTLTRSTAGVWSSSDTVNASVNPNTGVVTLSEVLLKDGSTVTATATDNAGNTSGPGSAVAGDITPPGVVGPEVMDDVGSHQGVLTSNEVTDDNQPTIHGAGATPGDVITVYDNGVILGTTVVDPDGHWSFTPAAALDDGPHAVVVTATDPAGNTSAGSPVLPFVVDTTAPAVASGQNYNYAENQTADAVVATAIATDAIGVTQWRFANGSQTSTDGYYAIDNNGKITLTAAGAAAGVANNDYETGSNSFTLAVQAGDAAGNWSTATDVALAVTNVNEAPSVAFSGTVMSIEAGAATAGMPVTDANGTDPDAGAVLTYSLTSNPNGYYAIDPNTGVVTLTQAGADLVNAGGNLPLVQATVTDQGGLTAAGSVSVGTGADATPPVVSAGQSFNYAENQIAGALVATATATDAIGVTQWRFANGSQTSTDGYYAIDNSGKITLTAAGAAAGVENNDYETGSSSFTLAVQAGDAAGNWSTATNVALAVTNVNEAPVITSNGGGSTASISVAENQTAVTTVTSTDVDGPTATYSISGGADAALFAIDASTGVLTFIGAPNFESPTDASANNVYDVQVTVSDGSLSDVQSIAVTLTNANEAPSLVFAGTVTSIEAGTATAGMPVTDANGTDPDAGAVLTYSLTNNPNGYYAIDPNSGLVTLTQAGADLVNGGGSLPAVQVTVADQGGLTANGSVSVGTGADATDPVVAAGQSYNYAENQTAGAVVATAAATDAIGVTQWRFDNGTQTSTDGYYAIDNSGKITLTSAGAAAGAASNDYETGSNSFTLAVQAGDAAGNWSTATNVTLAVTNVNEAPVITSNGGGAAAAISVAENQTAVTTITSTDVDSASATYSISGGADALLFAIDASTGVLTFIGAPNFESPTDASANNVYDVQVTVSDGSLTDVQNIAVTVTNANEAPSLTFAGTVASIEAGTATAGMPVTDANGTDPDAGAVLTYSLTNNPNGYYAIDPNTGVVTLTQAGADLVNGGGSLPAVQVTVADQGGLTAAGSVSVGTGADATVPVVAAGQSYSYAENQVAGAVVATATATDAIGITQWRFANGSQTSADGYYAIDNTGKITLTAAGAAAGVANNDYETGSNNFTLAVQAGDAAGNWSTATNVALAVTNVNEAPTVAFTGTVTSIEAGTATAGMPVTDANGSDPDAGAVLTYSLTNNPNGYYAIDSNTGVVTLTQAGADLVNGGGSLPQVNVTVTDNGGLTATGSATIGTGADATAPVVAAGQTASYAENQAADTVVATVTATDAIGVTQWRFANGGQTSTDGYYAIDNTGKITLTAAGAATGVANNDYETGSNSFTLAVQAGDAAGNWSTATNVTLAVTNVNEAPVITSNGGGATASISFAENQTAVTTVTSTDVDSPTATYSISGGPDAALFAINSTTGVLTFIGAPNFESPTDASANTVYDVQVTVSDGSLTDVQNIAVTVTNSNEAPSLTFAGTVASIEAGTATAGMPVTDANGTDPDTGAVLTYSLTNNPNGYYAIDSNTGVVTLTQAGADLVNGGGSLPAVQVTVADQGGLTANGSVSVGTGADATDPVVAAGQSYNYAENQTAGAVVATAAATDAIGVTQWRFDNGTQTSTDGYYAIDNSGKITLTSAGAAAGAASNDYETGSNSFTLAVQAGDAAGNWSTATNVTLAVTNVNEAPVITSNGGGAAAAISVAENQTAVTTITSADADSASATYSISGGADALLFAIDASTGVLTFIGAPNFESPTDAGGNNVYDVHVTVSDGSLTDVQTIAVTVTNVNEAPSLTFVGTVASIEAGTATAGMPVTDANGTDPDSGAVLTYSLTNNPNGYYAIDPNTGVVTLTQAGADLVNGGGTLPQVNVTVTDNGGLTATGSATIGTGADATAPVVGAGQSFNYAENQTAGAVVATATATDAIGVTQWRFANGSQTSADGYYAIDNSGKITLTAAGAAAGVATNDYETGSNSFTLAVQAGDAAGNWSTATNVTLAVTNVNEAPVITSNGGGSTASISVAENQTAVTTVTSTDVDGPSATYTISGGADASLFAINASTGVLTFAGAPNFEAPTDAGGNNVYDVQVTVSDGSLSDVQNLAVTVTNVNEAPSLTFAGTVTSIEAGTATAGMQVTDANGTDPDAGAVLTYSLTNDPSGYYAINPNTGVVTLTQAGANLVNGGGSLPQVNVTVTDNGGLTATGSVTIGTSADATAPVVGAGQSFNYTENQVAGAVVATATATDAIGVTQWRFANGTQTSTDGYYAIDNSGKITLTAAGAAAGVANNDYETGSNSFSLSVQAGDAAGNWSTATNVTLAVTNVNEAPVITSNGGGSTASISVAENQTAVTTVTSTDVDGPSATYSISGGADASLFAIDASTGVLTFIGAPNFESPTDAGSNNVYDVQVTVSDGSLSDVQNLAVTVMNANEAPSLTFAGTVTTIEAGTATAGMPVTDANGSDPDAGAVLTYILTNNPNGYYAINPNTGVVTLTQAGADVVNGGGSLPQVNVTVTDNGGLTAAGSVAIGTGADATAPVVGAGQSFNYAENQTAGAMIATVTATDAIGVMQWRFANGTQTSSDGYYNINNNGQVSLTAAGVAAGVANNNYETGSNSFSLSVQAGDAAGNWSTATNVSLAVTNVNEAPVITSNGGGATAAISVVENQTAVTTITSTDVDSASATYSISGGTDAALFQVDASTGELTFIGAPDFEAPADAGGNNVYDVQVTVSDGSLSDTQDIAVTVANVNEAPSLTFAGTVTSIEAGMATAGMPVTDANGSDPDAGAVLTFSLTNNPSGYYAINPNTGVVTLTQAGADLVNGGGTLPAVQVTVADQGGLTVAGSVSVGTGADATAPVVGAGQTASYAENQAVGAVVATVTATDAIGVTQWRFANGSQTSTDGYYAVDNTGKITLTAAGAAAGAASNDYETGSNSFTLAVQAGDAQGNWSTATNVALTVTDVNDAPTVAFVGTVSNIETGTATAGMTVTDANGTDPDTGAVLTYSLTNNPNGYYAVNPNTGVVTLTQAGADLVNGGGSLPQVNVTVTDNGGLTAAGSVAIGTGTDATAPVVGAGQSFNYAENQTAGAVVATATATDAIGVTQWRFANGSQTSTDGYYAIDNSGKITLTAAGAAAGVANNDYETGSNSFSLSVQAGDAAGNWSTATNVALAVTNVNEAPSLTFAGTVTSIEAGTATAGMPVTDANGTDPDTGAVLIYSLTNNPNGYYAIDPNTGVVTLTQAGADLVNGGGTLPAVQVTVADQGGLTAVGSVSVGTGADATAPVVGAGQAASYAENQTAGAVVATATATDAIGVTQWRFANGSQTSTDGYYAIDNSGKITLTPAGAAAGVASNDYETGSNSFTLAVQAGDAAGNWSTATNVALTLTDVNEAPVITSNGGGTTAAISVAENQTAVTTVTSTDVDGPSATYSISGGTDALLFAIDPSTGVLTFIGAPNFEAPTDAGGNNVYDVQVTVSDSLLSDVQNLAVTVTNVNEAPSLTFAGTVTSIEAGTAAAGMTVTDANGTDPDAGAVLTYSLTNDPDGYYAINPNTGLVSLTQAGADLVNGGGTLPQVNVTVTDNGGLTATGSATIGTGADATAPVVGAGQSYNYAEDQAAGAVVATATATDAIGVTQWRFANGTQTTADGYYAIDNTGKITLTAAGAAAGVANNDYETGSNNFTLAVQAGDAAGNWSTATNVALAVTNVNEAPTLTFAGTVTSIEAGTATAGMTVTDANGTDSDAGAVLTYSLTNNPNGYYAIDSNTGVVTLTQAGADLVNGGGSLPQVNVTVTDNGGLTATGSVSVGTGADATAPVVGAGQTFNYAENQTPGAVVATATATDAIGVTQWRFATGGQTSTDGNYAIDNTGKITLTAAGAAAGVANNDYETGSNNFTLAVHAGDAAGNWSTATNVALAVTNVNEAPVITSNGGGATAAISVAENQTAVTTITSTDVDGPSATYSISGGADALLFAIDPSTGVLTFIGAPNFEAPTDAGGNNVYDVQVTVSDGSLTDVQSIAVTVTNANEAPSLTFAGTVASIEAGTATAGMPVTDANGTDPDAGAVLTYSLTNNPSGYYAIDSNTGVVTLTQAGADLVNGGGSLPAVQVTVTDQGGLTSSGSVSVGTGADATAPVVGAGQTYSYTENQTSGAVVATVTATDAIGVTQWRFANGTQTSTDGYYAIDNSGKITLTAAGAAAGVATNDYETVSNSFSLSVQAGDATGNWSTATNVSLAVTNVNEAPVITSNGGGTPAAISVAENQTAVTTVTSTDVDGPSATYSISGGADATRFAINATTGVLTFVTAPNYESPTDAGSNNVYDVQVTGSDGSLTDVQNIAVTVTNINEAPFATSDTATTNEDTALIIPVATLLANDTDVDGNTLTIMSVQGATHGTVSLSGGNVTFTPDPNFNGPASFTYTVSDGNGLTSTATVDINVNPVNDPAVFGGTTTGTVIEAGGVANGTAGTPTATGTLTSTDIDNPANSFTAVSTATASTNGYGTYTMTAGGVWNYTLDNNNAAVQALNAGGTLTDTFTVTSVDRTAQTVTVTINGSNDSASISGPATGSVTEDGTQTAGGTLGVADVDAGQASFQTPGSLTGTYGTFTFNAATGVWGYTLNNGAANVQALAAGQQATDTLTVTSTDGTATQNISVTITGTNDAPVITSNGGGTTATILVAENQTAVTTVTSTDVDGPTATYSISGGADASKFTINASTGVLTFVTAPNYESPTDVGGNNVHDVQVTVSDGILADVQAIAVTVTNVNEAPVNSLPASFNTNEDTALKLSDLSISDVDSGAGSVTVTLSVASGTLTAVSAAGVTVSNSGTSSISLSGTVAAINAYLSASANQPTFTPVANANGAVALTMVTNDGGNTGSGGALSDTDTSIITVVPVNDAPSGTDKTLTGFEDAVLTIAANDFGFGDIDGNTLASVNITQLSGLGTLFLDTNGDGIFNAGEAVVANQNISKADLDAGRLKYIAANNASGSSYAAIKFALVDNGSGAAPNVNTDPTPNTLTFNVTAVADAPTLNVTTPASTLLASGQGLRAETWSNVSIRGGSTLGNGLDSPSYLATLVRSGNLSAPTLGTTTNVSAPGTNGLPTLALVHQTGYIYLEAGKTYTFSSTMGDDTLYVTVGGTHVGLSRTWGANSNTAVTGTGFTPTLSGYYALDVYAHNQSGDGNFNVSLNDGSGVKALSTTNFRLYTGLSDITDDGVRLSSLLSDGQGGYYQHAEVRNEGSLNTLIPLSNIAVALTDTDGSEFLGLTIGGIPAGATLSDGSHSWTNSSGTTATSVDLSSWTLNALKMTAPTAGTYTLQVNATSNELSAAPVATTSTTISVLVHDTVVPTYNTSAAPSASTGTLSGTSSSDILVGGSGADTLDGGSANDVLIGNAGNDTLIGGFGNDTLTGGAGNDIFRFAESGTSNMDKITDFTHGSDKIDLDNAVFTTLGGNGALTSSMFQANASGNAAANSGVHLIFDKASGELWYDADGSGAGAAQLIAAIYSSGMNPATTLDASDFRVI